MGDIVDDKNVEYTITMDGVARGAELCIMKSILVTYKNFEKIKLVLRTLEKIEN